MFTESQTMLVGETKKIRVLIENTHDKGFEVSEAHWELKSGEEVESSGFCEIQELCHSKTILSALITPMRKNAVYSLEFNYTIDPEVLIYVCEIRVY